MSELDLLHMEILHPLRFYRQEAGLSQAQLSRLGLVGVSEQYLQRIESGLVGENTDTWIYWNKIVRKLRERYEDEDRAHPNLIMAKAKGYYLEMAVMLNYPEPLALENANKDINEYTNMVHDWYRLTRWQVRRVLAVSPKRYRMDGEFDSFESFARAILVNANANSITSVYAISKLLKLHIFSVQAFSKTHTRYSRDAKLVWPQEMHDALVEIGLEPDKITFRGMAPYRVKEQ